MASMIHKCVEMCQYYEGTSTVEDAIIEACATYEDYGKLIIELLCWSSGTSDFEDRAAKLAADMLEEYIAEVCPESHE